MERNTWMEQSVFLPTFCIHCVPVWRRGGAFHPRSCRADREEQPDTADGHGWHFPFLPQSSSPCSHTGKCYHSRESDNRLLSGNIHYCKMQHVCNVWLTLASLISNVILIIKSPSGEVAGSLLWLFWWFKSGPHKLRYTVTTAWVVLLEYIIFTIKGEVWFIS